MFGLHAGWLGSYTGIPHYTLVPGALANRYTDSVHTFTCFTYINYQE